MSKIAVDLFEHRSAGRKVSAGYVVDGSAKSWANLNGSGTIALRDSLNISSVVDNGVGIYFFSFATAFAAADYSFTAACGWPGSQNGFVSLSSSPAVTVTGIGLLSLYAHGNLFDPTYLTLCTHGELA